MFKIEFDRYKNANSVPNAMLYAKKWTTFCWIYPSINVIWDMVCHNSNSINEKNTYLNGLLLLWNRKYSSKHIIHILIIDEYGCAMPLILGFSQVENGNMYILYNRNINSRNFSR